MGMDVNEARREGHVRAVDRLMSIAAGAIADDCDAPIVRCHVGHERRRAVPVINQGMRENCL